MHVLILGKSETITVRRPSRSVTLSSATFTNPSDGTEIATATVANDSTAETLLSSSSRNSYYIYASGLTVGADYVIETDSGKSFPVHIIGITGTEVEISDPLPFDIDAGTVYGITATATITIPSDYDEKSVVISYTWSDGTETVDEALAVTRRVSAPITSEDLYQRWSRLRGSAPIEMGGSFDSTIDSAMDILRLKFWQQGILLDDIRTPSMIRELVFAQTAELLADMGYDPSGTGDMVEFRSEMRKRLSTEMKNLVNSRNLWIDSYNNNIAGDDERGTIGWRMRWD